MPGLAAEGVLRPEGPGEDNFLPTLDLSLPVVSSGSDMTWGLTGERPGEEGSFRAGGRLSLAQSVCCGGDIPCINSVISSRRTSFLNHLINVVSLIEYSIKLVSSSTGLFNKRALILLYSEIISLHLDVYAAFPESCTSLLD